MLLVSFFILILTVAAFIPKYVVVFLAINLVVGLFLSIFQIIIALLPRFKSKRKNISSQPFVSIIVPAYNEPPAILISTIDALSRLNWKNFEVIIIDNNTQDSEIWRPVENFVNTLGPKFRFFHVDHMSGFKAGAINYLLKRLDKKSEYTAVIDADYVVEENFLKIAMPYFIDDRMALVQFPQRYRNCTIKNEPIVDEYNHFFGIYMNMANHLDCVPSTGTVSLYKTSVLIDIGGFRGESLTEDADVGLRIYGAGYRGVYVDRSVGYGLMPYDLEAYRKQKWRWAYGNAQSLKTLFRLFGKIPFRSWIGFLSHLTAWHHFDFLPLAALAAFPVVLLPFVPMVTSHRDVLVIASVSIFMTLVSKSIIFLVTLRGQKRFLTRALRALMVHMGMTLVYSEALLVSLFQTNFAFERTNKFVLQRMPSLLKNTYVELILGLWYLMGIAAAVLLGKPVMFFAFVIAAFSLFSIYYIHWKIISTKPYSKKIILSLEREYEKYIVGGVDDVKINKASA